MNIRDIIPIKVSKFIALGLGATFLAFSFPLAIEQAQYQPLSRPLFIYVNATYAQKNKALRQLIDFYLERAPELVSEVGYVPLPEEAYNIDKVTFHKGEVGTVFEGKSQFNLTIPELLRKQARF